MVYARMAALQQEEAEAAGARGGRHMGRGGNARVQPQLAEMERIYRMLEMGNGNYGAREDKFTLDDAFTYAESNVAPTKEEPLYQRQAKAHEKQLATEDTLIESLLRILI